MAISNKQRLYGQLILDFANAKTTDEAGLKYFENLQKVFDLPYSFIEKAIIVFPTLKDLNSFLTDSDIQCLDLISKIKMIQYEIASLIYVHSLEYDIYSNTIHIDVDNKIQLDDGSYVVDTRVEPVCKILSIDKLKKMIRAYSIEPEFQKCREIILLSSIPEILRLGEKMISFKEMTMEKYKRLYEIEENYANVKLEHEHIEIIQKKTKSFLERIIHTRIPHTSKILNREFIDEDYFIDRSCFTAFSLEKIYDAPIDYCIALFFNNVENIEHLKKCELCKKFYIAKKLVERQRRCSECSTKTRFNKEQRSEYQRNYRQQIKKLRLVKEHRTKIDEFMKEGYSRKEAEKLASEDA